MEFQKSFGLFNSLRREEEGEEGRKSRLVLLTSVPLICPTSCTTTPPPQTNTSKTTTEVFCPKCLWSATWILTIIISISIASISRFLYPISYYIIVFPNMCVKKGLICTYQRRHLTPFICAPRSKQHVTWPAAHHLDDNRIQMIYLSL